MATARSLVLALLLASLPGCQLIAGFSSDRHDAAPDGGRRDGDAGDTGFDGEARVDGGADGDTWQLPPSPAAAVCRGIWCWENPLPVGEAINGAWHEPSPSSTWYAVGSAGTILRHDGSGYALMESGTTVELTAIWGVDGSTIIAVGARGTALHFDGTAWDALETGTLGMLRGVAGSGPDDALAVGAPATVLSFDGTIWEGLTDVVGEDPRALQPMGVAMAANGYAVIVGGAGAAYRAAGSEIWQAHIYGGEPLTAVWTDGALTAAVGGDKVVVWVAAGYAGTSVPVPLRAVWGVDQTVRAVGGAEVRRYAGGGSWPVDPDPPSVAPGMSLTAIAGHEEAHLVAGDHGVFWRRSTTGWTRLFSADTRSQLTAVRRCGERVWAVGHSPETVCERQAVGWACGLNPSGSQLALHDLWCDSSTWIAVADGGRVLYGDAASESLTVHVGDTGASGQLRAIWGAGATSLWIAGDGVILHGDGSAWEIDHEVGGHVLRGLWGPGAVATIAVGTEPGASGLILTRGADGIWQLRDDGDALALHAVWGTGEGDIWALGAARRHSVDGGESWEPVSVSTPVLFNRIVGCAGAALRPAIAVGNRGEVHGYDGGAWRRIAPGTAQDLAGVWCEGADLLVVGADGAALHAVLPGP